jgi:uncharacterized membrane protein YhaH (DUF805 family)
MLLLRPLMRYADFKGRASRAEYWLFMTTQGLVYGICIVMAAMSLTNKSLASGLLGLVGWLAIALLLLVGLTLPNYAIIARRLHDIGRSAKWIGLLLPVIASHFTGLMSLVSLARAGTSGGESGAALAQAAIGNLAGGGVLGMVAVICSTVLTVMMLLPGTRGPNRFGSDPRDPDAIMPTGPAALDDDRWDALIAEAKSAARGQEPAHKPVFDFGPGPTAAPEPVRTLAPTPVDWGRPAWDPGVAPSRPFGRRT